MKRKNCMGASLLALAIGLSAISTASAATVTLNDNVTAIYGGGNPDNGWTTAERDGVSVSLRAKNRATGEVPNSGNVYQFETGFSSIVPLRSIANIEFSINSDTTATSGSSGGDFPVPSRNLNNFDFWLGFDTDASAAVSYTYVNALTMFNDNSYGNATTANGQGVEGTAAALAGSYNIAQNSQNQLWLGVDPTQIGIYDYVLFATELGAGPGGSKIAQAHIIEKNGAKSVPDGGSTAVLMAIGVGAMGFIRNRRK